MLNDILPFRLEIDTVAVAGASLWSLALYLACYPLAEWVIDQLNRWFNFAERSLYTSLTEFEKTRQARESQNAFYASLFSILPFLLVGTLSSWGLDISLGHSWAISLGILACICSGIYEIGRREGKSE
jgi:hypothetical protein